MKFVINVVNVNPRADDPAPRLEFLDIGQFRGRLGDARFRPQIRHESRSTLLFDNLDHLDK